MTKIKALPEPTLRRIPKYIHLLMQMKKQGVLHVSSATIADELGLDSIQVRKDLSLAGIVGKPKVGFEMTELVEGLMNILNWGNLKEAFLAGAGNLGEAILGYKKFNDYGLNIVAAFDNDESKIGKKIYGIEILPIEKIANMIKRMHIKIGVITAPPEHAQEVANLMIEGGIWAIWNFAPVHLKIPEDIILENVQLSHSLSALTYKLAEKIKTNDYKIPN